MGLVYLDDNTKGTGSYRVEGEQGRIGEIKDIRAARNNMIRALYRLNQAFFIY